jgi:hypothetical protein
MAQPCRGIYGEGHRTHGERGTVNHASAASQPTYTETKGPCGDHHIGETPGWLTRTEVSSLQTLADPALRHREIPAAPLQPRRLSLPTLPVTLPFDAFADAEVKA